MDLMELYKIIKSWGTSALILVQDELSSFSITFCFLFRKKCVKRLDEIPEISLSLSL